MYVKTRLRTSRRVDVLRHLDRVRLQNTDALRVGAPHRQRADAISPRSLVQPGPSFLDDADELVAGRERRLRHAEIRADAEHGIGVRHPAAKTLTRPRPDPVEVRRPPRSATPLAPRSDRRSHASSIAVPGLHRDLPSRGLVQFARRLSPSCRPAIRAEYGSLSVVSRSGSQRRLSCARPTPRRDQIIRSARVPKSLPPTDERCRTCRALEPRSPRSARHRPRARRASDRSPSSRAGGAR